MNDEHRDGHRPLADRMRPESAEDIGGQSHLLAAGMPLASAMAGESPLPSMILWGPPGCGKTTLARALFAQADAERFALSAATAGLSEVRAVIAEAESRRNENPGKQRVLFVDEVHRFNKTQQDAFLPHVEGGLFAFVGATTENPSFELNRALLSRLTVFVLHPLDSDSLAVIARRAAEKMQWTLDENAMQTLLELADGDARRMLNIMEQAAAKGSLSADEIRRAAGLRTRRFDRGGDSFYDQISALHKSVRGSDPDAALYWMQRMLDGGADPRYIGRRLIRMASEDIGLADPRALGIALEADEAQRRLGAPEGELALAQAALYLSCAPKSNAACRAFQQAGSLVRKDGSRPVPMHLRNAPTKLLKDIGAGANYRYAHDEPDGFAAGEHYFPEDMQAQIFYRPTARGIEAKIRARLSDLRERNRAARKSSSPKSAAREKPDG